MARILLLEDSEPLARILTHALHADGHSVVAHGTGVIAYERSVVANTDVMITDIDMPKVNGIEAIQIARQSNPKLDIVAMSGGGALDEEDYLSSCKELGANVVLRKPVEPDDLVKLVNDLVEAHQRPPRCQDRSRAV